MGITSKLPLSERLRKGAGALVVDNFFRGLSVVGKLDPRNDPEEHGVRVLTDVPYHHSGDAAHHLDVFVPQDFDGPRPIVLYVHGGGFRILSKDTHFGMALQFAKRGYLVFNINYRLAPRHPFPAAIEDACRAYRWVVENAHSFDGDLDRVVLAGESAGGNLVCGLTIAAHYERDEPWARSVFETGVTPTVTAPACGMLQVSDVERYTAQDRVNWFVRDRLEEVSHNYLPPDRIDGSPILDFADPLLHFERGDSPTRQLPAFFLPVGTKDILLDDTRRLARALDALGAPHSSHYYPGEIHAFHALVWRPQARKCWRQKFAFLEEHVGR
ncbi:alpha/beta hydrolase [Persicimonas caeni]|uniref:Alpha/beta hydrolase n=1 Tax=Persicimonas caeni TaxID=2292766 RepID=A0A4Y6PQM0_PERCE|nr:alpha/beta hydrolase [Persicimonas caeni]QDG50399.1 alpha/beta hydrolase [Persicimonas caeni]QED31620.1 alpha/beta hydrolase [Persicimonas caeni]